MDLSSADISLVLTSCELPLRAVPILCELPIAIPTLCEFLIAVPTRCELAFGDVLMCCELA